MIGFLAVLALAVAVSAEPDAKFLWQHWKSAHGRVYATEQEEAYRMYVFAENHKVVSSHPANATYTLSLNKFADLTFDEWRARYVGGYRPAATAPPSLQDASLRDGDLPDSVDWVAKGAVTPIKNQGQCGSCWAFSTTGGIEGINFINTGNLVSLSEQQLVDCAKNGNEGCNGGDSRWAAEWIIKDSPAGLCTEADYPYTGKDGKCEADKCTPAVTINGIIRVEKDNATALMAALVDAPQSIAVDASSNKWQFYSGGVMDSKCGDSLDHAVLAVGYGSLSGTSYFTVKNSWGADWGAKGYILLGRDVTDEHGECGILKEITGYTQASN